MTRIAIADLTVGTKIIGFERPFTWGGVWTVTAIEHSHTTPDGVAVRRVSIAPEGHTKATNDVPMLDTEYALLPDVEVLP